MKRIKLYEMGKFKGYIYPENTAFEVEVYKAKRLGWRVVKFIIGAFVFFGWLWILLYITQGI